MAGSSTYVLIRKRTSSSLLMVIDAGLRAEFNFNVEGRGTVGNRKTK